MKRCLYLLCALCLLLTGCSISPPKGEQMTDIVHNEPILLETSVALIDRDRLLTKEQGQLMIDLLSKWYRFIGSFEEENFAPLFAAGSKEADQHAASCRTLVAIREKAVEDLRLRRCDITLTVTEVETDDGEVQVELNEDTVMQFAGLDVVSELFALPHIFKLCCGDEGWVITHHEADDNPFFSFTYEEGCPTDPNLPLFLQNIQNRQQQQREEAVPLSCDHPYDRDAAIAYMMTYCAYRNTAWHAYDDVGGNCMNFASQVLLAGGIPMDYRGDAKWYWESINKTDLPFINVGNFLTYAQTNEGFGLVADADANYYTGEAGDLLIFGVDSPRHMTEICGLVQDSEGNTIDYLLCSNTTNYRNFPAGAYYYTGQRLIKIYGWND